MSARRIYCAGIDGKPCAAHAWWLYEGFGRPRERCDLCWGPHDAIRHRERNRDWAWKRRQLSIACGVSA